MRRSGLLALPALALASGLSWSCRPDVRFEGTFRCDDGVSCPEGERCVGGQCLALADGGPPDVIGLAVDAPIDSIAFLPFGAPRPVAEVNSLQSDDDPSLTADLLQIFFESDRDGNSEGDIWWAVRSQPDDPFDPPVKLAELSSPAQDGTPEISADGLTLYFHSSRPGGDGGTDIYRSTRGSRDAPWDQFERVPELCTASDEGGPVLSGDGLTIVFGSSRPGGPGMSDLWQADRPTAGDRFANLRPVAAVNGGASESEPWIDATATVLFLTSTRDTGAGQGDLWMAVRPSPEVSFDAPRQVTELASGAHEADAWLSPDLRTIYFSRNGEIYRATR